MGVLTSLFHPMRAIGPRPGRAYQIEIETCIQINQSTSRRRARGRCPKALIDPSEPARLPKPLRRLQPVEFEMGTREKTQVR